MFPKASQNQFALMAPQAWVLFFLSPQLFESTSWNNSGIRRQDPLPYQSSLETSDTFKSSEGNSGSQLDYPNLGFSVQDNAQQSGLETEIPNSGTWNQNGTISRSNQQLLEEIRQIRAEMNRGSERQKSQNRNSIHDQREQQVFDAELTRLVQQQGGAVEPNPNRFLRQSPEGSQQSLFSQPDDRFVEKKEGPSMLAPLDSEERNQNNRHRGEGFPNRQLTPQKAGEHFLSSPLERQARKGSGEGADSPSSLRGMARRLDQIAADLEEARMYGQADEIRATAKELWKTARHLKTPHAADPPQDRMPRNSWNN